MIKVDSKWHLRIICLLLAVILWFVIINEQNPTSEGSYTVPVTVENLNSQYIASNVPTQVYVRLQGPRNTIINIGASDLKAYVDLSNAQEGEMEVALHLQVPKGTELKKQSITTTKVYIDRYAVKEIKLTPHLVGKMAPNLSISSMKMVPDKVVVSGAQRLINTVNRAVVDIPVKDQHENFSVMSNIRLLREDGSPVEGLEMTPWQSNITVNMMENAVSKKIPVYVSTIGSVSDGLAVKKVTAIPTMIEVRGTQDVINSITSINLSPINVTGINRSTEWEMAVPTVQGAVFDPDTIRVSIEVGNKE